MMFDFFPRGAERVSFYPQSKLVTAEMPAGKKTLHFEFSSSYWLQAFCFGCEHYGKPCEGGYRVIVGKVGSCLKKLKPENPTIVPVEANIQSHIFAHHLYSTSYRLIRRDRGLVGAYRLANVHSDGMVCWGNCSQISLFLRQAYNQYWTSLFNMDLASCSSLAEFRDYEPDLYERDECEGERYDEETDEYYSDGPCGDCEICSMNALRDSLEAPRISKEDNPLGLVFEYPKQPNAPAFVGWIYGDTGDMYVVEGQERTWHLVAKDGSTIKNITENEFKSRVAK
jgi:hypothetical protein